MNKYKLIGVKRAVKILSEHQTYRLGFLDIENSPSPRELSSAMLSAIAHLSTYQEMIKDMPDDVRKDTGDNFNRVSLAMSVAEDKYNDVC